jgi:hypothetical protein
VLSNFFPILVFARDELLGRWRPGDVNFFALSFGVAWLFFAGGLTIVGVPLWWAFHRMGWRSARAALALGFVATFSVSVVTNTVRLPDPEGAQTSFGDSGGMVVEEGHITSYGWYRVLWDSTEFALLGAVVGAVIWRLAYKGPSVRWRVIPGRE